MSFLLGYCCSLSPFSFKNAQQSSIIFSQQSNLETDFAGLLNMTNAHWALSSGCNNTFLVSHTGRLFIFRFFLPSPALQPTKEQTSQFLARLPPSWPLLGRALSLILVPTTGGQTFEQKKRKLLHCMLHSRVLLMNRFLCGANHNLLFFKPAILHLIVWKNWFPSSLPLLLFDTH